MESPGSAAAPEKPWLRKLHWACVTFGLLVTSGVLFVWWHDGRVSQEATACYDRALKALGATDGDFPPGEPESSLKRCGLEPAGSHEREWKLLPSTAWETDERGRLFWKVMLPVLAFIPSHILGIFRSRSRRRAT
jgi:hypothetical protein